MPNERPSEAAVQSIRAKIRSLDEDVAAILRDAYNRTGVLKARIRKLRDRLPREEYRRHVAGIDADNGGR